MSEPVGGEQKSYRARNIVLAIIVGAVIFAAGYRLAQRPADVAAPVHAAATMPGTAAPQGAGAIEVEVSYSGSSAALPDAAKVYVFIRPVGERMPLAVQTFAVGDLPVAVEFSAPNGASASAKVEAVARLSLTGAVTLGSGDSEAVSAPVQFDATTQRLSLNLGDAASVAPVASAAAAESSLAVHLALGKGIELPADTTVFLIVREPGGPPMPLAVRRLRVGELPADVTLSDADAMVPGRSLAAAQSLEVIARTSRTGDVKGGPGDWEAHSAPVDLAQRAAGTPLELVMDQAL
jgi:hypothetical protein